MANTDIAKGFILGVAVAAAIPITIIVLSGNSRPLGRAVGRGVMVLGDKARETAAELGEIVEDMLAEMRQGEANYHHASRPHVRPVAKEQGPDARAANEE